MEDHPTILITGAAGNLGGLLARHLADAGHSLRLMFHRSPLPVELSERPNVTPVQADLGDRSTLPAAVTGADVVVHFAGVLFAPRPEKFLPTTNTRWFSNLLDACLEANVSRVILISFPHVEGETNFDRPARGALDCEPISVHARTRLEEERLLFQRADKAGITPIVLRLGLVYGAEILMVKAARRLARRGLLCVWREPTWYQFLSIADYLTATEAAILKSGIEGIYHVGDDRPVTIQQFLDRACDVWGWARPRRIPFGLIYTAAALCEAYALLAHTASPLTRDFVRLGRVSHWGDTGRAREELIPTLQHPTLESGLDTLR